MVAKYIIFAVLFVVLSESWAAGNFLDFERNNICVDCEYNKCNVQPEDCDYGRTLNSCGLYVCKKGPGQRCGGAHNVHGECGAGMSCTCSKCTGCYTKTVDCMDPDEENLWKRKCFFDTNFSKLVHRRARGPVYGL